MQGNQGWQKRNNQSPMTTSNAARAYAEARLVILNREIQAREDEKQTIQRFLSYLPEAGPGNIQRNLQALAEMNPAIRSSLHPILTRTQQPPPYQEPVPDLDEDEAPASLINLLSPYRQEMFRALPEIFTRNDMLRWIHSREDDLTKNPAAETKRAWGATHAFKTLKLIRTNRPGSHQKIKV